MNQDLSQLQNLVQVMEQTKEHLESTNEQQKENASKLRVLTEEKIPNLMDDLDLQSYTSKNGDLVELRAKWVGNISDKNRPEAMRWLRENGHEGIIRNQIIVDLEPGDDKVAREIEQYLIALGASYKIKETVHHSTLTAWINEQKNNGEQVDDTLFGVFNKRSIKVTKS